MTPILNTLSLWVAAGGLLTVLAAVTRLWPYAQRILWDRVKPPYRVWLTTVPAVLGCVAGVLANPADWLTQVEALLVVLTPLLAPGVLPAGAKHAAVLLLLGGLGLAQTGCAASLEETRAQARLEQIGPMRLAAEPARPPECAGIDKRRQVWSGVMWGGLGVAAGAAVGGALASKVQDLPHRERVRWGVGLGVASGSGAATAGVGKVELDLADEAWAHDCAE